MYKKFVGTFITVAVKDLIGASSERDMKIANMMLGGLLLDECETYIYLGEPDKINTAICKDQIIGIFTDVDEITEIDEKIPPGTVRQ